MCLIVVAHRASDRFPLIIAANRDEDYARPTRPAHRWEEAANVFGGRDVRHGGSWLASTRDGRVAAVTNLRGAARPDARSRGLLVRDFVLSQTAPLAYAEEVQRHAGEYAGFHLIVGERGGTFVHLSDELRVWEPGVHGVGNDAIDTRSERIDRAVEHVAEAMAIDDPQQLADELIAFLGSGSAFVAGDRYGTRSSTAIVASPDQLLFVEKSYGNQNPAVIRDHISRLHS
jgi:uncharacterized protein with NRDE domain